jgi:ABC-2 type transport system permease protein
MREVEPTTHRRADSAATGTMSAPMHAVTRVYQSRELLWNLTLRELRTKYRRSFLGWAWSMLNPLATVAVYGFVFGVLFEAEAPQGDPSGLTAFALYMLCALLPWNFFSLVNSLGLGAVSGNSGLVRRVAFPTEILVFSNVLHACVQFSIEMTLLFVVLLIAGSPIIPWLPVVILTSLLLTMFATGFALALSALAVYFRDMNYLWTIVLQVWFFGTPIVYSPQILQDQAPDWVLQVLELNPMLQFVAVYRRCLYDGAAPGWTTFFALVAVSASTLAAGWAVFRRFARRLPEEV